MLFSRPLLIFSLFLIRYKFNSFRLYKLVWIQNFRIVNEVIVKPENLNTKSHDQQIVNTNR